MDLRHTNSIFCGCMGEWVEEIGMLYDRVLVRLFREDSLRAMETMYPFRNLWKAHRILPATKMILKLASVIFYQILFFSTNDSPSETIKIVFYFI